MNFLEQKLRERDEQWKKGIEECVKAVASKVEMMDEMRTVELCIKNNETLGDAVQHLVEQKFGHRLHQMQTMHDEVMLQSKLRQAAMDRIGALETEMERLRKDVKLAFAKRFGEGVSDIGDSTIPKEKWNPFG